jgi:hypothetical protein
MKSNIQKKSYSELLLELELILRGAHVTTLMSPDFADPRLGEQVVGTLKNIRTRALVAFGSGLDGEVARIKAEHPFNAPVLLRKRRAKKLLTDEEDAKAQLRYAQIYFLASAVSQIVRAEIYQEFPQLLEPGVDTLICSKWQVVAVRHNR